MVKTPILLLLYPDTNCNDVLLSQNQNFIFNREDQWNNLPGFQSGSALYRIQLRDYSVNESVFQEDMKTARAGINQELMTLPGSSDVLARNEYLMFTSVSYTTGGVVNFFQDTFSTGDLASPRPLELAIVDGTGACNAKITTVFPFAEVGMLNRLSPLLALSIRDAGKFFDKDTIQLRPDDETTCNAEEEYQRLLESLAKIGGGEDALRLDFFMDDMFRLDACNRPMLTDKCQKSFADRRADVTLVEDKGWVLFFFFPRPQQSLFPR